MLNQTLPISQRPIQYWINLFETINNDHNEESVDFSDIEFYSEQISNLCENSGDPISDKKATNIANHLSMIKSVSQFLQLVVHFERSELVDLVMDMIDSSSVDPEFINEFIEKTKTE